MFVGTRRLVRSAALVVLVTACGDSTGPGTASLTGTWRLTHSGISAGGESCSIAGTTMVLNQSGAVFSGTYHGGIVSCGGDVIGVLGTGIIVNGAISGSSIEFNLDNNTWHNEGTLTASGMSGTSDLYANVGSNTVQGTGAFEASKE
jgi:hypothetical protein